MPIRLLTHRKKMGNARSLTLKKDLIDFASNDYLGLAKSKQLHEAIFTEWSTLKTFGSTGSRLLTGNSTYIELLEKSIARFHGFSAGLIFNCGYMANLGLASSISNEDDIFIYDIQIHASLLQGIKMSKAKGFAFRHNDLEHLENRLKNLRKKRHLYICIQSIYSTTGSIAPLIEIFHLSQTYGAKLIVDEAHAIGLIGESGKGLVFDQGLSGLIFAQIVTFGKALGTFGAIVLGSHSLKEILINFAQTVIYTTALPFPCLAAIKCSYELLPKLAAERQHIQRLISHGHFSKTHIQPIPIKGNKEAQALSSKIAEQGFDVPALLSPTVQRGKEILRLTLHSFNSSADLGKILEIIG